MHLAHKTLTYSPNNRSMRIVDARDGVVRMHPNPRRKVAIVGAGYGKDEAPYDDPEWEVWALNVCGAWDSEGRLRADRWFELHQAKAQSDDDMLWIAKCPFPIYVPDDLMHASPNAVRFPIEMLERSYGDYWACTFAYQMALALFEDFTDVGLYGVELAWGTERERTVEWACVSWWAAYLEAKGVRMHFPAKSCLGRHPYRYGLEYDEEIAAVKRYLSKLSTVDAARDWIGMGG